MSNFAECIEAAVKAGRITRDQAEELFARQQDAADRFRLDPQHSPESAARMAEELGIERGKQNVRLQKYQAAKQAIRNADNVTRVLEYSRGETFGVRTLLARDGRGLTTGTNVETLSRNILGQAHATMAEAMSQLRTRWVGLSRDRQLLRTSIREMFGEATGDARASSLAKAWATAAENLRLRFNRAGGAIPKRADWGLPQIHDAVKVGNASVGEWVDFTRARLDLDKMIDVETGAAFTPDALEVTLQGVYETIRSNGISDMVPGAQGGKKLGNRRQEARFLAFRDADTWLEYQDRFGSGNLFGAMTSHLHMMARDIALMEVLGPNPSASFRMLQDVAAKAEDQPIRRAVNQGLFNVVNGTGDRNKSPFVANLFGAIRSWNVASKLGRASISAISDLGYMSLTTRWTGLSATREFMRFLSQLNPANEADRIFATRTGITSFSMAEGYSNAGRFSELGGSIGSGAMARAAHYGEIAAEITIRASGLSAMTDGHRRAFALELSATIAENFGKRLDDIEGNFGLSLRERGMTPDEWDLIRQTPTTDHKGARFFTVDQLMAREDLPLSQREALANRIQGMFNEEVFHAVPEPDALTRVVTTGGGAPRGGLLGDASRSIFQFKSFPIAVLSTHFNRMLAARQLRGGMSQAAYAAHGIIVTTVLGMVAMQLKLISKGKNPRDMDTPEAWAAAFTQGGGAGLYGDFFFNDANRFGQGPITSMMGPTVGLSEEALKLTWGNVQQLMAGEDPKLAADVVGFAKRYMPGGSLWYTGLVLEREVWDQLQLEADPRGTRQRINRAERRARDLGSDFWWRPGERVPDRLPELGVEE